MSNARNAGSLSGGTVRESIETIVRLENNALRRRTWADSTADNIAEFTGTIWFVAVHLVWFGLWAAINTGALRIIPAFDPYPFQLLCMIVSMEGVLLSTFVLIKQNRLSYLSDRRSHLDLQINLLSEREITRVLRLTEEIAQRMNVQQHPPAGDLAEDTQVETLVEELDRHLNDET